MSDLGPEVGKDSLLQSGAASWFGEICLEQQKWLKEPRHVKSENLTVDLIQLREFRQPFV